MTKDNPNAASASHEALEWAERMQDPQLVRRVRAMIPANRPDDFLALNVDVGSRDASETARMFSIPPFDWDAYKGPFFGTT